MTQFGTWIAPDFPRKNLIYRGGNMKSIQVLLALAIAAPVFGLAQSANLDAEVSAELDKMYQSSSPKKTLTKKKAAPQIYEAEEAETTVVTEAPVIQKQPKAYIEATPLVESKAEKLRKARQEQELYTEQTMVEKLEQSRIDDEKQRGHVLFGDKLSNLSKKDSVGAATADSATTASAAPAAVQQAPAPVINVVIPEQAVKAQPKAVVEKDDSSTEESKLDKEMQKSELSAAMAEFKDESLVKKTQDSTYFSANVGMGEYPDASNVRGQYALGFAFGKLYQHKMAVEGSFMFSNYQVEQTYGGGYDPYTSAFYPRITDMDQYNGALGVKYYFLTGALKPMVGGLASYTYRTFKDTQLAISKDTSSSHAVDVGFMVGFDLELTESFTLGLDARYLKNLTSRVNGGGLQKSQTTQYDQYGNYIGYNYNNETPIEKLNYWIVGISGKSTF